MYPFTRQLIKYNCNNLNNKLGMLILDVKGNYYTMVKKYAAYYNRMEDLIIIEIRYFCIDTGGFSCYNVSIKKGADCHV